MTTTVSSIKSFQIITLFEGEAVPVRRQVWFFNAPPTGRGNFWELARRYRVLPVCASVQHRSVERDYKKQRVQTVLAAATGLQNKDIVLLVGLTRRAVSKWRKRWTVQHQHWQQSDSDLRPKMHAKLVLGWLADQKGRGKKATITLEQRSKIAGLCQETPEQNNIPVTHWTLNHLVDTCVNPCKIGCKMV